MEYCFSMFQKFLMFGFSDENTPSLRSISTFCNSIWSHVAGWLWQIIPLTLSAGGDESHWRMGCIKWFYSIRASGITQAILFFCLYPLSLFCKLILRLQVPWILSGTIRENILLGKEHIPERYSLELLTDGLSIFWHFHPSLLCLPCPCSISIKLESVYSSHLLSLSFLNLSCFLFLFPFFFFFFWFLSAKHFLSILIMVYILLLGMQTCSELVLWILIFHYCLEVIWLTWETKGPIYLVDRGSASL